MNKSNWHRPDEEMNGKLTSCPKCDLEFKTLLYPFCTHKECPVRDFLHKDDEPVTPPPTYEQLDCIATELQVTCDKQSKRIAYLDEYNEVIKQLEAKCKELEQENQILIEELKETRAESGRFGVGA